MARKTTTDLEGGMSKDFEPDRRMTSAPEPPDETDIEIDERASKDANSVSLCEEDQRGENAIIPQYGIDDRSTETRTGAFQGLLTSVERDLRFEGAGEPGESPQKRQRSPETVGLHLFPRRGKVKRRTILVEDGTKLPPE
jgi:hypothetical protein